MTMLETKAKTASEGDGGRERRALCSASLTGSHVPARVLLAPWGAVESSNGSFIVDDEAARLTTEAFGAHGTDLPIDYEHQTLGGAYASPNGQAPAAGWIKQLTAMPGVGLLADIEWTEQAEKMLAAKARVLHLLETICARISTTPLFFSGGRPQTGVAINPDRVLKPVKAGFWPPEKCKTLAKEYRYLSPVAIIRKNDRRLVAIHSAALTNKPAIRGMEAIVNRRSSDPAEDVSADDLGVDPLTALRMELQLTDEAGAEEVLVAAGRRLSELRESARQDYVEQRIVEAMRAGKLVEAQRAWAEALVAKEEGLFDDWLCSAPVIVQPGRSVPPSDADATARRDRALATRARAEYRANPLLTRLTDEDAYVACAARDANGE